MNKDEKESLWLNFDFMVSRRTLLKAALASSILGQIVPNPAGGGNTKSAEASPTSWSAGKTTLTYYGQSTFMLTHGDDRLLFDPWFTDNPWNAGVADDIECNYILVSHAHPDHIGGPLNNSDAASIARRVGAKIISIRPMTLIFKDQGCDVHPMDIGGKRAFDFGYVRVTPAFHDSMVGGHAAGFIVNFHGTTIYHAGDTSLFGDMALLAKLEKLDYVLLPIGDNFTMGPQDALEAVGMLKPNVVIPMHYNSNPLIKQSPDDFKQAVEKRFGIKAIVMQPGQVGGTIALC